MTEEQNWEERGLRAAVLEGDEAAWRALYERTFDAMYAYVYIRCGRNRERAEDMLQDCWAVAVKQIRSFDPGRATFRTWMYGIADNIVRNHQRKWARRADLNQAQSDPTATAVSKAELTRLGLADHIALTLASLPDRYQAVLRAKYEESLSVNDIAQRWAETSKAVESLLSRARTAFREEYRRLEP